jgi:SET domain-containing protein
MDEKSNRVIMYKEYLEVRDCRTGKGVFSKVEIPANSMIIEVTGPVLLDREVPDMNEPALLQVGPNTYIGASGDTDDFLNHSCDPNCKMHVVGNRAFLYSLYVIPANAELTFDYSTTSTESHASWKMDCCCKSNKCRKVISGFQYLEPVLQDTYKEKSMVPLYIVKPSMFQPR